MNFTLYGFEFSSEMLIAIAFIFVLLAILSGLITLLIGLELNDLKKQEQLNENTDCYFD